MSSSEHPNGYQITAWHRLAWCTRDLRIKSRGNHPFATYFCGCNEIGPYLFSCNSSKLTLEMSMACKSENKFILRTSCNSYCHFLHSLLWHHPCHLSPASDTWWCVAHPWAGQWPCLTPDDPWCSAPTFRSTVGSAAERCTCRPSRRITFALELWPVNPNDEKSMWGELKIIMLSWCTECYV